MVGITDWRAAIAKPPSRTLTPASAHIPAQLPKTPPDFAHATTGAYAADEAPEN
jgi:hypothetical protein